ncbi:expressed protein [Phakopsora pachyrhizi]|uniref:Expressed protein n=1 Tax=Phakopsora pachyrhizi TaxID=170000 RepID=A0AAV0AGF7_PHAPC|nr:expressed protein [Phakopsora pachyrhizi]
MNSVWSLFGGDPIKQHELEHNHQIGEGTPMVRNSPRVHRTDPQSSSPYQASIESRFSGANELRKESLGLGELRSDSGHIGANSDIYSAEHPQVAENLLFTSAEDNLHHNIGGNFNHNNEGAHPERRFSSIPEFSADLYHYPEQGDHSFISSIQGNHDYQLCDNYVIKPQNEEHYALDSVHNYQDYDSHLHEDLGYHLDNIHANLINQDYGTYNNQNIDGVGNRNHNRAGESIQDRVNKVSNPTHEQTLHLNHDLYEGPDLIQNFDVEQNPDKNSMKEKHHPWETQMSRTYEDRNPTIYSDFAASYKLQQSVMKFNYQNSAGVYSPNVQSSSLHWPDIAARSGANEALDKIWLGDLGSNSGHNSANIDIYSLEHSNIAAHSPLISSGGAPNYYFKENVNHMDGGNLPKQNIPSIPEFFADLHQYPENGHNLIVPKFQGNHGHQVHEKNQKFLDSEHHYQEYYNHYHQTPHNHQGLLRNLDSNHASIFNQDCNTGHHENIETVNNVIFNHGAKSIQQHTSDDLNMSHENALHQNDDKNKGPNLIQNPKAKQNIKNISMQKKQKLTENVTNFQSIKNKNTLQKLNNNKRKNNEFDIEEAPHDIENIIKDLVVNISF